MKVKIIRDYNDLQLKKLVKKNTELEVTEERGAELIKAFVAEKVETITPETETPAAEQPPKKTTRKKKEASK